MPNHHSRRGKAAGKANDAEEVMPSSRACPTRKEACSLAREMLADDGTRWPHVRTAGHVAARLEALFMVASSGDLTTSSRASAPASESSTPHS